jgi:carbonic anhydrase
MKKLVIAAVVLLLAGVAYSGGRTHWGYSGAEGPEHWGELSSEFSACSEGKNQSPINLTGLIDSDLKPIGIHYQVGGNEIFNNGHTVQVNFASGSKIFFGGHEFELKQYHFHAPSEHHINGKSYPMEAHLVHSDRVGNLAVIAVMFLKGKANESIEKLWAHMPENAGEKSRLSTSVTAESILPSNRDYYRYNGSLTTPPCSEGVRWVVMKKPITASRAQIEKFIRVMHRPNNRPLQPVNAHPVLK